MNKGIIKLVALLLLGLHQALALPLEDLQASYRAQISRIVTDQENSLDQLRVSYLKSLSKTEASFQKAGRLEDVLSIREEKEEIEKKNWPLPTLDSSAPQQLTAARRLYDRAHLERAKNFAQKLVQTAEIMEEALRKRIDELTKAGQIEEATSASQALKEIRLEPVVKDALDLLAQAGSNGASPAAYRIRRFGDEIEVIVQYDQRGKISMDSPVENVTEITGGKKEKGATKAKVLGEFIGAKGYDADGWVIYENALTNGKTGALSFADLDLDANAEGADGERGLKITVPRNSKNPNAAIANALPPKTDVGNYELSFSYYLPSANREITGLVWHQGFGAPIENTYLNTTGKWTAVKLSSESLNEYHHLRFYLQIRPGSSVAKAAGEAVFLRDLKVEQVAFTTYLVDRYGKDGRVEASFAKREQQKPFTSLGKLIPQNN